MTWKPAKTAPKDGKLLLIRGTRAGQFTVVKWDWYLESWLDCINREKISTERLKDMYWMSFDDLPPPPQTSE